MHVDDFGQSWHCLRHPRTEQEELLSIAGEVQKTPAPLLPMNGAAALDGKGHRTLLIDIDPQAQVTGVAEPRRRAQQPRHDRDISGQAVGPTGYAVAASGKLRYGEYGTPEPT